MFVQTKSSLSKNGTGDSFETVVFKSKKRDKHVPSQKETSNVNEETKKRENDELDIKKLRYEVIKFGTTGFQGLKKEESRVAFAVALGAKPPKNKCRNYVDILLEKKRKKELESASVRPAPKKVSTKTTLKRQQMRRKGTGELLNRYGKVPPK